MTTGTKKAWPLVRIALLVLAGFIVTPLAIEGAAQLLVKQQQTNSCQKRTNRGIDFKPNCVSQVKLPEGPWIHDLTNECGWRTRESCLAKRPNSLRVSVLGTSLARGLWVDYPDSWAARATVALSNKCHRPVDFQNLAFNKGSAGNYPLWDKMTEQRLQPALNLKPDVLVVIFGASDLLYYKSLPRSLGGPAEGPTVADHPDHSLIGKLKDIKQSAKSWKFAVFENSVAINLYRQWYDRDPARYSEQFAQTTDFADYIRAPLTSAWQLRLKVVDHVFSQVATLAQQRRVPWIVIYVPLYAQAATAAHTPPGEDAYIFNRTAQKMIEAKGGIYLDTTPTIAHQPHPEDDYYVVDNHPNRNGDELISKFVVKNLIAKAPAFAGCA